MDRDRRLAEMMGLCKHRGIWGGQGWVCYKCKEHIRLQNSHGELDPNFSTTPADAYALMQFVMAQEWWGEFYSFAISEWIKTHKPSDPPEKLFAAYLVKWLLSDPDRFAVLVAEFRGWKP